MKRQQKIIELRTAAKLKVAEIETKISVARSKAAEERARLLCDRAADLKGLDANSTERLDVLARSRADLSWIESQLATAVAEYKLKIQETKAECEKMCAAAEDDPETMMELPQQETIYCDGSEHTARIVARRMINKMPHIQKGGYLFMHIIRDDDGYFVGVSEQGEKMNDYVATTFSKIGHCEKSEVLFVERAREMFKTEEDKDGAKAAGPMSRALDALFGGNPVDEVDNIIADTVKNREKVENE